MAFFFSKFRWETELQVHHLPTRGRMTWNMELSSREKDWSRSDKSNILSSTVLTPFSITSSTRVISHVFMQHWKINGCMSLIKWPLATNAVGWQMLWSWRAMLKGDLLGSTSPLWATTPFDVVHPHCPALFSQAVLLWVLKGTVLERSVLLQSKSHRGEVIDIVLHQAVALRSLCKSIHTHLVDLFLGLEIKPFWAHWILAKVLSTCLASGWMLSTATVGLLHRVFQALKYWLCWDGSPCSSMGCSFCHQPSVSSSGCAGIKHACQPDIVSALKIPQ